MKIQGPLVIDISKYDHHINTQELIDGGVKSVIVGLYSQWDGIKYGLNSNSQRLCEQVAASTLVLQTYYYYYPQFDPIKEANWFVDIMLSSGFPIKFAWADCEDHRYPMEKNVRSENYRRFTAQVASRFGNGKVGVYSSMYFMLDDAPEMNLWVGKYPSWVPHWGRQPSEKIMSTWEELNTKWLPNYNILIGTGQTNVVGHQFTGDRFMLPGVYNEYASIPWWPNQGRMPLDVSVFTPAFIESLGVYIPPNPIPIPVPPPPTVGERYEFGINPINNVPVIAVYLRKGPGTSYAIAATIYKAQIPYIYLNDKVIINGYAELTDKSGWVYIAYFKKV